MYREALPRNIAQSLRKPGPLGPFPALAQAFGKHSVSSCILFPVFFFLCSFPVFFLYPFESLRKYKDSGELPRCSFQFIFFRV